MESGFGLADEKYGHTVVHENEVGQHDRVPPCNSWLEHGPLGWHTIALTTGLNTDVNKEILKHVLNMWLNQKCGGQKGNSGMHYLLNYIHIISFDKNMITVHENILNNKNK